MSNLLKVARWGTGSILLGGALLIGLNGIVQPSLASGYGEGREHQRTSSAPMNEEYQTECGSCHLAYPANLLPASSWKAVMNGLDDHFGENAEVATEQTNTIMNYLVAYSAHKSDRFSRGVNGTAPLRITELPYFTRKHDEIPAQKMVLNNPDVRSFSNCDRCHQEASQGSFDEDSVSIPGFAGWHD